MAELDLDALRRIPVSALTWISRDEWSAILAALERVPELEREVREAQTESEDARRIMAAALERAEIRCSVHERLETAAQALIDVLQDDDPTEFWWFDEYNGLLAALAAAPEGRHG